MFSPCYPGSPRRTPTIKTCKKSRCSSVLTLTKSGPSTWTWSPGAASLAAHCSWMSLGEDSRMGKSREHLPPSCMCMCVCVPCCVAIKRACPPDFMSSRFHTAACNIMEALNRGWPCCHSPLMNCTRKAKSKGSVLFSGLSVISEVHFYKLVLWKGGGGAHLQYLVLL